MLMSKLYPPIHLLRLLTRLPNLLATANLDPKALSGLISTLSLLVLLFTVHFIFKHHNFILSFFDNFFRFCSLMREKRSYSRKKIMGLQAQNITEGPCDLLCALPVIVTSKSCCKCTSSNI